jgi:hypothetical protein
MHPHAGDVEVETLFHLSPDWWFERSARIGEGLVYAGWCPVQLSGRLFRVTVDR